MARSEPCLRKGFSLPAVLAVTGVVTLIFLVAITALASLMAEAASARARVRFLERAMTVEATIAYIVATEPFAPRGIEIGAPRRVDLILGQAPDQSSGLPPAELRLDGRPYSVDLNGPLSVSLQDQAGMINIGRLDDDAFRRLMLALGVAASEARDLRARYIDYVDADDLKQVNGAEKRDYEGGGPPNRGLIRPTEWLSVLGARTTVDPARWHALRPDLAHDPAEGSVNLNTATPRALEVRFGLTAQQAEAAIEARNAAAFSTISDFNAATGAAIPDYVLALYTYPSGPIIYTIRDGRSAWVYRGRLAPTPGDLEQPVRIDQTELLEAPGRARAETLNATRFPYPTR